MSLSANATAVEVRRLSKLFGTIPALIEVDLVLPAGAVCGVLGPNGAGKTTLLRVLSTSLSPTGGAVRVFGRDVVADADRVRELVDVLPSYAGLYPELTALENMRFALRMRGVASDASIVDEALEWAGLGAARDLPGRSLSTGMARRLVLARLRVVRPRLLLLDEPYGAVDHEGRTLVDELIVDARAAGSGVVVASHAVSRLRGLADLVVELERGCVVRAERADARLPVGRLAQR